MSNSNFLLSVALMTACYNVVRNYKMRHLSEPDLWQKLCMTRIQLWLCIVTIYTCSIFIREGTVCRDNICYLEAMCSVRAQKERSSARSSDKQLFLNKEVVKKLQVMCRLTALERCGSLKRWSQWEILAICFLGGKKIAQILYLHFINLRILKEHILSA